MLSNGFDRMVAEVCLGKVGAVGARDPARRRAPEIVIDRFDARPA
jgi:hypothetical protein